jgi:nitroreductase
MFGMQTTEVRSMLRPFDDDESLYRLIRTAQMAPSVHNTQPWVFWILADDRLELRARVSGRAEPGLLGADQRLHVADPLSRELAISCGAALLNLRLAFRVMGHDVAVWLIPDADNDSSLLASVEIVTGRTHRPSVKEQKLYAAIPLRHTNRSPFTGMAIPPTVQAAMKRAAFLEEGWLRILDRTQAGKWMGAAAGADAKLEKDPGYVAELKRWTRDRDPGSGVPAAAIGARGKRGDAPVRDYGLGGVEEERFERRPQLLTLSTDGDQPVDWLRAGQALQRVLLTATVHGVSASFLTQPMELSDHEGQPRRWPWHWPFAEIPQMVLRVGYATRPAVFTPRRDIPDVFDLRAEPPRRVLPPAPRGVLKTTLLSPVSGGDPVRSGT